MVGYKEFLQKSDDIDKDVKLNYISRYLKSEIDKNELIELLSVWCCPNKEYKDYTCPENESCIKCWKDFLKDE